MYYGCSNLTSALQNTKWTWSLYSVGGIQGHSQNYGQYSLDEPYIFTDLDCCQYPRYLVFLLENYRSEDKRHLFGAVNFENNCG